jgi:hypothetical protein
VARAKHSRHGQPNDFSMAVWVFHIIPTMLGLTETGENRHQALIDTIGMREDAGHRIKIYDS